MLHSTEGRVVDWTMGLDSSHETGQEKWQGSRIMTGLFQDLTIPYVNLYKHESVLDETQESESRF